MGPETFPEFCARDERLSKYTQPGLSLGRYVDPIIVESPTAALKHVIDLARNQKQTGYLNFIYCGSQGSGGLEISALNYDGLTFVFIEQADKYSGESHTIARAAEACVQPFVTMTIRAVNEGWKASLAKRFWEPKDCDMFYRPYFRRSVLKKASQGSIPPPKRKVARN